MANEIQVSTSFPALREINKSLKVLDKLLPSSYKLKWHDLDVSMQCFIFHDLFFIEDIYPKSRNFYEIEKQSLDQFFLDFLSNRDCFLDRYIDTLCNMGEFTINNFRAYGVDCIFLNQDLLNKYCEEFSAEFYMDSSNEYKVKYLWKEVIMDYAFLRNRNVSKIKHVSFSLYENGVFSIVNKNGEFLKEISGIKSIAFDGVDYLEYNELKSIFSLFNENVISSISLCHFHGNVTQRDLNMICDFFPKVKNLVVGWCIENDTEVIQDYSFLAKLNCLELFSYIFKFEYSSDEDFKCNKPYENLKSNISAEKFKMFIA